MALIYLIENEDIQSTAIITDISLILTYNDIKRGDDYSKIIKPAFKIERNQDKIGMTPDADIYLKDIRHDLCDLDTKLDGLESMLKDIQKTLNEQPVVGDIHRIESKITKLDDLDIKQFTVDEKPAQSEPKFKVGDTVKYKTGSISYFVIDVKESNYKYFYDLERVFDGCPKRNYKIAGILESRLEEE